MFIHCMYICISLGMGGKPWSDTGAHAANDFYAAKAVWSPTWFPTNDPHSAALQIDWVKVTQINAARQLDEEQQRQRIKNKFVKSKTK